MTYNGVLEVRINGFKLGTLSAWDSTEGMFYSEAAFMVPVQKVFWEEVNTLQFVATRPKPDHDGDWNLLQPKFKLMSIATPAGC